MILGNCPIPKRETVVALIQKAGAAVIFLPPYSPEFSPIENCWSKIKSLLRSLSARTYPELVKAMEQAFAQVSLEIFKVGLSIAVTVLLKTEKGCNILYHCW